MNITISDYEKDIIIIGLVLWLWFLIMIYLYTYWPDFKMISDNMSCNLFGFKENGKVCNISGVE